jgi:hypothetical protein
MKIKMIVVDLELSTRAKRIAAAAAIPLLVLGGGAVAYANVPHTWKDGDVLRAEDLNEDFEAHERQVSAVESHITLDGGYELAATYCGRTPSTAGDLSAFHAAGTGYVKARAQCQVTCSSAAAHMCTSEEMLRSLQLGKELGSGAGWYASGAYAVYGTSNQVIADCAGLTSAKNTDLGLIVSDGQPAVQDCNLPIPVMCCK